MLGLHTIRNPGKLNECENSDGTVNNKLFAETYLPQSKAKIENIVEKYKRELKTYTNNTYIGVLRYISYPIFVKLKYNLIKYQNIKI